MESEEWNSKRFTKYYFQVFLEDEEETSLFMDSWIYLDHEVDEELPYTKECKTPDQDVTDNAKKLEKYKFSQVESFSCNSSAEDNQHNLSVTVPHFQISDEPKNMNMHKTSIEYTPKDDDVPKTTCTDTSELWSSELPAKALCIKTNVSEHAMFVYNVEDENSVESSDSGVVGSSDTISESLSFVIDDTIGFNETQSLDVSSLDENIAESPDSFIAKSTEIISKSLSSKVLDTDVDNYETNTYSSNLYISVDKNTAKTLASGADKSSDIMSISVSSMAANYNVACNEKIGKIPDNFVSKSIDTISKSVSCMLFDADVDSDETNVYSSDLCISEEKNTAKIGADKFSDIISKPLLSAAANDTIDYNEINTHPSHMYCSNASRSFMQETMNSVRDSSETYKYSTNVCSIKVENVKGTPYTHVSKSSSSETDSVKFVMDPFIKSESNWPSKRETQPVSSKIQKKTSSEGMEVVIIDDDEAPIIISDDEAPIVISDDEDSDIKDSDIIYIGSCSAILDEKPSLEMKIKHKHKEKVYYS